MKKFVTLKGLDDYSYWFLFIKSTLLFQEEINQQFDKIIPRQTALRQLTARCVLTSRGHGVVYRWRLSRIMFRELADSNKLSGVQRAIW